MGGKSFKLHSEGFGSQNAKKEPTKALSFKHITQSHKLIVSVNRNSTLIIVNRYCV